MSQFSLDFGREEVILNNGEVLYYPNFFSKNYFSDLRKELHWRSDKIKIFGKVHSIPRLHCWYGDPGITYEYSGIHIPHNHWNPLLLKIRELIQDNFSYSFNGMLGNLYRGGSDYVSWHSDDEESLGEAPIIACASFGEERVFLLRNKLTKETIQVKLEDRSLLVMLPPTQELWEHQISKTKLSKEERISLTFRFVHQ